MLLNFFEAPSNDVVYSEEKQVWPQKGHTDSADNIWLRRRGSYSHTYVF